MQDIKGILTEEYFSAMPSYPAEDVLPAFASALKDNARPALSSLCLLLCLVFISAVIKAGSDALFRDSPVPDICTGLACAYALYSVVSRSLSAVRSCLDGTAVLMDTMSAGMAAKYGLTGNIVGGSSSVTVMMLTLQVVRLVSSRIVIPLTLSCFGVSLLSVLGFDAGLSRVCGVVKRASVLLCAVSGAVVCALLAYQTVISRAADTASLRAVRFASSSFIPIIGGSLSESAAAVRSALSAVRVSSGVGGIVSLLLLTLPAAVSVVSSKLCVGLCSFLCSLLGADGLGAFFDDCGNILSTLLAATLTVCVVFTVACALFCI